MIWYEAEIELFGGVTPSGPWKPGSTAPSSRTVSGYVYLHNTVLDIVN